jgi:hypothetical protein
MKNLNILKTISFAILMVISFSASAQNKVASSDNDDARAMLVDKKFNLLIHNTNGSEGMKDFIVFSADGFESKAGKSSAAASSRYTAKQDANGNIQFTATIVTSEGMKTYSGMIKDNAITGKYIFEATGQPAVSYAINGTLDTTK